MILHSPTKSDPGYHTSRPISGPSSSLVSVLPALATCKISCSLHEEKGSVIESKCVSGWMPDDQGLILGIPPLVQDEESVKYVSHDQIFFRHTDVHDDLSHAGGMSESFVVDSWVEDDQLCP